MNALINHNLKAICLTIPKNASFQNKYILNEYYDFNTLNVIRYDFNVFSKDSKLCYNNEQIQYLRNNGIYRYYETLDKFVCDNKLFTKEKFNEYYKFAFVRNPYDKLVSSYVFYSENRHIYNFKFNSFNEFVSSFMNNSLNDIEDVVYSHSFITQYDHLVSNDGTLKINFIGKVENLNEDLIHE